MVLLEKDTRACLQQASSPCDPGSTTWREIISVVGVGKDGLRLKSEFRPEDRAWKSESTIVYVDSKFVDGLRNLIEGIRL